MPPNSMQLSGGALDLACQKIGSGPPVIVLHGLLGSGRNWQSQAKALAAEYAVYSVDLRNHGASPWSKEMTYSAMAADILRLIEREDLREVALVGHSMGGKAAMTAALMAEDVIARLVVVDVAPVRYRSGFEAYVDSMIRLDLAAISRRSEVEAALAATIPETAIRAFLAQNAERHDAGLRWKPNLQTLKASMETIAGWPLELTGRQFSGPSLFLSGGRSDYVLPEYHGVIAGYFPSCRFEAIDGAGHWLHAEAPTATLAAIRGFLN